MLVLTRRLGEEIVIADNIRISVVALEGRKVRLGITAPASVRVLRLELLAPCSEFSASPEMGGEQLGTLVDFEEQ